MRCSGGGLKSKVQELLFRAEFFLDAHQAVREALNKSRPIDISKIAEYSKTPIVKLTLLNANLYFSEAVSCIASLLRNRKTEISFYGLEELIPNSKRKQFQGRLKEIHSEYKRSGLKEARDEHLDHKNLRTSGAPVASFMNLPEQDLLGSLEGIIGDLKRLYSASFPDEVSNNYFSSYYVAGIQEYVRDFRDSVAPLVT
jgi:hypothetical protein